MKRLQNIWIWFQVISAVIVGALLAVVIIALPIAGGVWVGSYLGWWLQNQKVVKLLDYRKGDATQPIGDGERYIIHISNNQGGWGRGFVLALSGRWPEPERAYREWFQAKEHHIWGAFQLGSIQRILVEEGLSVINMIAQEGYNTGGPPIRYTALEQCLTKVAELAKANQATIHAPRFGSGLAGGKWDLIEPIINRTLHGLNVTIYDLP